MLKTYMHNLMVFCITDLRPTLWDQFVRIVRQTSSRRSSRKFGLLDTYFSFDISDVYMLQALEPSYEIGTSRPRACHPSAPSAYRPSLLALLSRPTIESSPL